MESKPIVLEDGKLRQTAYNTQAINFFTSFCCGDFSDFNINCLNEIDCGIFGNDTRQIIDLGVVE
jgi:hypothetical protein